jgi:hypothetical protein
MPDLFEILSVIYQIRKGIGKFLSQLYLPQTIYKTGMLHIQGFGSALSSLLHLIILYIETFIPLSYQFIDVTMEELCFSVLKLCLYCFHGLKI